MVRRRQPALETSEEIKGSARSGPPLITVRAVVLGVLTIAAMFFYIILIAQRQGSGRYVQSQYPIAAFMPFVLWLVANVALKLVWPRLALRRGEMLTLFSMTWVVAAIPVWIPSLASILATPAHFADAENRWAERFFDYLPWHVLPPTTSRVIDYFWYGLPEGMAIPWDGWLGPIANWMGVSVAMVAFGYCLLVVFQRQWQDAEKLTYPLAQLPADMTEGFDGKRRFPEIFYKRLFWIGFGVVFLPQLYNIGTYFTPGLPSIGLFWTHYVYNFGDGLIVGYIRLMPLMLMVIYLCPVDILGSMVLFHWIATIKLGLMKHLGTPSLDFSGWKFLDRQMILHTESNGAMVFVGLWSIWIARSYLRQVWRQVQSGEGDPSEVRAYRLAVAGMVLAAVYVIAWAMHLGVSPLMAIGTFALMTMVYFVTVKLVAASGIAYVYPNRSYLKGESFSMELIGSVYVSAEKLVPYKMFTSYAFFGGFCIPAWPAIAHHLRIFSFRLQPAWVTSAVFISFVVGFGVAVWGVLELSYADGTDRSRSPVFFYDGIVHLLENPITPHWGKWAIWWSGFFEAASITFLRARFHWFPIHPIGLIFQYTHATWWYGANIFVIWLIKLTLLHYGGVRAYLAGKPFFYGLGIGYVLGVILSTAVDFVWFPTAGHYVHGWPQ